MNKQSQRHIARKMVPALIGGKKMMIDLNSLQGTDRTVHHGNFKGTEVHSSATQQIGDSVLYWPDAKKRDVVVSAPQASFGITAIEFLQSHGYTVTAPQ